MRFILVVWMLAESLLSAAQDSVYLFSYFKGNGEDGLHLAWSDNGLQWEALRNDQSFLTPELSKDKLMRDPCIIRGADGLFHMVWTVSWNDKGVGYASSKDLLNWSDQLYIPVMAHEDSALNCWAPEITQVGHRKQYIIYWATTIAGKRKAGEGGSEGRYNHRMYYVKTRNFKKFSKTKVLYDKGFSVIDATIFPVGKTYAMILKDETRYPPQKNLRIAFSKHIDKGWSAPSAPITGKYWAEGPTVAKIGAQWLVYFDKYTEQKYGAVGSADLQQWTDLSEHVRFPSGTRHGTIFKVSREEFARLK